MRYLSGADLVNLVSPQSLISSIENGLVELFDQKVILRARDHITFDRNTLLTMPVIGSTTFGTKVVSVHPSNAERGWPVINGLMCLFDRGSGTPLAVMNAAALTAQRTGAVGAIGLKYTTSSDINRLGVVGTGVQGTWQAIFACAVRPIREIYFFDHSDAKAGSFTEAVSRQRPEVSLIRSPNSAALVSQSQAIITATTASTPVLPDDLKLLRGRHLLSVGSFKPNMQELPDAAYKLVQNVVVDSDAAKTEVGDLINPIRSGTLQADGLIHLGELVSGRRTVATADTTIFKSVGLALYDLYAAQIFNAAAEASQRGTLLDL